MRGLLKELPAYGVSFAINAASLLAFHFIVLERFAPSRPEVIATELREAVPLEERDLKFSEDVRQQEIGNGGVPGGVADALPAARVIGDNQTTLTEHIADVINPEVPRMAGESLVRMEGSLSQTVEVRGHSDDVAGGIEGAMDRMAFEIRQSLRDRKTLVIWLFDASGSLNDRRAKIADRFDSIYRQLAKTGSTENLYSAVISYGQSSELLTADPIQDTAQLSNLVRNRVQVDNSGVENVFVTVKQSLEKYRNFRRNDGPWSKMIIIVTDERGDDAEQYLEESITLARKSQTKVFTIGNSAVFGRKEGYVRWTYSDGFSEYLPVDQGPEGAVPEVVQLPFIGSGEDWRLRQMSSSYGPYALTRLCAETGGLYLITEESQGFAFNRSIMRAYAPDYRPVAEQLTEIRRNPAKSALMNVAGQTYDDNLPVPALVFRAFDDATLREDITNAQRPIAEVDFVLQRMLNAITAGENARDTLTEPRWQAAFDLAMGRVLAMRVRYFGYNQILANMKVSPKAFENKRNNMWRLAPSSEIDAGPETRKAAANAKKYLQRVIDEHPETPWAMLAKQELASDLGWSWREFYQAPPPEPGSPEERAQLLLAEEQQRQRQQQRAQAPRDRPKL